MASKKVPTIETPRLLLTVPGPRDAERMLRYVMENRAHLAQWEPVRPESYYSMPYWKQDLAAALKEWQEGESLRLVLLDRRDPSGPILGSANFRNVIRGPFQACTLGYGMDNRHQGRGLMREALAAVTAFVFGQMGLHRIMANYMPRNERSGRLLEHLGFLREGLAKDYLLIAGRWEDHVLTALTNPRWEAPPA